ncbi:hypothetical protein Hanom_Chr12g01094691 [Helianthus anomalus]
MQLAISNRHNQLTKLISKSYKNPKLEYIKNKITMQISVEITWFADFNILFA